MADADTVSSPHDDLTLLISAAREAADVAMARFDTAVQQWTKADASPVSEADIAVDERLSAILRSARPDYGWVSEESALAHGAGRRAFVVDPIDGTRAFLDGGSAWAISVAVVEGARPIAAVIMRPPKDHVFAASAGGGASLNGTALAISTRNGLEGARVAAPRKLFARGDLAAAGAQKANYIPSLALRLAKLCTDELDAMVAKGGAHHWDVAAGDLIVEEAGGALTDLSGRRIMYDTDTTLLPPLIGGPARIIDALKGLGEAIHFDPKGEV
ncbi:MAG: 3'(2'),5'-bisphosphate nucleotidase CysQ [Pseudomonadota bacterium]